MILKAQLISFIRFNKKTDGQPRVLLNILGDPVPVEKGDGLFVNQQVVKPEAIAPDLKAGNVEIEKSDWSNYITFIRNAK